MPLNKKTLFIIGLLITALVFSLVYGLMIGFSAPILTTLKLAICVSAAAGISFAFTKELIDFFFTDIRFSWLNVLYACYGVLFFIIPVLVWVYIF